MMYSFSPDRVRAALPAFQVREQRVYVMLEKHAFFRIHFQSGPAPQAKMISVVHGSGLDYLIDLGKESRMFRQWKTLELRADRPLAVYIPPHFGHAFLSMSDDTVQLFASDQPFTGDTGRIHWQDPDIGLIMPADDIILSEADEHVPFLREWTDRI